MGHTAQKGEIEARLTGQKRTIVGVDEVGRGCLAGPVFAACAIIDYDLLFKLPSDQVDLIRDSKTLSAKQRNKIVPVINSICCEYAIESAHVFEIEQFGIVNATFLAMKRALAKCEKTYDVVLTDGNKLIPDIVGQQIAVIKGDQLCYSIAAASILAKQKRDFFMQEQATCFPLYGFDLHVGYGTKKHLEAIKRHGICPLHRRNFSPISQMCGLKQTTSNLPKSDANTDKIPVN